MAPVKNTKKPTRRSNTASRRKKSKKKDSGFNLLTLIAILAICTVTVAVCIVAGCGDENISESSASESEDQSNSSVIEASTPDESLKTEDGSGEENSGSSDESSKDSNESSEYDESSESENVSEPDESSKTNESSDPDDSSDPDKKPLVQPEKTKQYEELIGIKYAVDMTEYEAFVCPDNEAEYVYLVNPAHPLASDYVPEDLVKCTSMRKGRPEYWSYMNRVANEALEAFLAEAAYYGFDDITVTNAYRSYSSQKSLFEQYCKKEIDSGKFATEEEAIAHVLTYSTRPGTSEHQSGLCCDMHNRPSTNSSFNNTPEAKWLAANAHRFGFILRYPEGKQHITGIKHESWHFRYVGRTAATEMYKLGITLDEYLADEEAAE